MEPESAGIPPKMEKLAAALSKTAGEHVERRAEPLRRARTTAARLRFGNGAGDQCPLPSPDGGPGLACDHPEAGAWDLQTHGRSGRRRGPAVRTRQRRPRRGG